jgi:hypothetical protein
MMKAVQLCGSSAPPEQDVASMLEANARVFGYPTKLSDAIISSFHGNASAYMTSHFKTDIPVRFRKRAPYNVYLVTSIAGSQPP